jgi:acetyl esterase/lipase
VADHVSEFGGTALTIGGESAGAHLSVVTILRLRDRHGRMPFHGANLMFGAYDLRLTPSARAFGNERLVLRTVDVEQFSAAFLPGLSDEEKCRPDVSPLFGDLTGLCPALFTVGTRDGLLDDSLFMHARWVAAGNRGALDIYPGAAHGFSIFPGSQAADSLRNQAAFLNAAVGEGAQVG